MTGPGDGPEFVHTQHYHAVTGARAVNGAWSTPAGSTRVNVVRLCSNCDGSGELDAGSGEPWAVGLPADAFKVHCWRCAGTGRLALNGSPTSQVIDAAARALLEGDPELAEQLLRQLAPEPATARVALSIAAAMLRAAAQRITDGLGQ